MDKVLEFHAQTDALNLESLISAPVYLNSPSYLVRNPTLHAHGDLTSLAPHERLPEILVVPRELQTEEEAGFPWGRSGYSKRSASRLERRAESLASPRDEA